MHRAFAAAARLTAGGASVVVVGSVALALHGDDVSVADLDVVPDASVTGLTALRDALAALVPLDPVPSVPVLGRMDIATIRTSYGPVDVLLERGRADYATLRASAGTALVDGVPVVIAARAVAWTLRRRFKDAVV